MGHEAGKTPATVTMSGIRLIHDRVDALPPDHPHALTFLHAHGSVSRKTRIETARGNRDEDLPGRTPKQKSTEGSANSHEKSTDHTTPAQPKER